MIINAKGIRERIYVNLEAMYPTPYIDGSERCSEELMALQRGYLDVRWTPEVKQAKPSKEKSGFEIFTGDDEPVRQPMTQSVPAKSKKGGFAIFSGEEVAQPEQEPERSLTRAFEETMTIRVDENGNAVKKKKHRKIKRMEVNETQTSKSKAS